MADIKTFFAGDGESADYALDQLGMVEDSGLETAVIISLFSDRRAEIDDPIPDGGTDRRGWWADAYPPTDGDLIGSRLWLLSREKQLNSVVNRAKEYAEEALQWMVDDGVATSVTATPFIVRQGMLGLPIAITRPDGRTANFRFNYVWSAMNAL